jgi:subtilisin family serine protease
MNTSSLQGRAGVPAVRVVLPLLVLLVVLAGCSSDSVPRSLSASPGTTRLWVNLRSRPHLEGADAIADFAARGQAVVDELQRNATTSQAPLISFLQQRNVTFEPFWITNSVLVDADEQTRQLIAAMPDVESIEPDRQIVLGDPPDITAAVPETPYSTGKTIEWNVTRTRAPKVWDDYGDRGKDVVVGVIDTGWAFHPALNERYRGYLKRDTYDHNYNWANMVDADPRCRMPCDGHGHGTHVTGTILGKQGDHIYGVAPEAQFISCRALGNSGSGSIASVVKCYQWFLAPTKLDGSHADTSRRPNIVSASLGSAGPAMALGEANTALVAAGILSVAAAGNNGGCGTVGYPGGYSDVLTVGALANQSNTIAGFSSGGPASVDRAVYKPDLVAGGQKVTSAWLGNGYVTISGTSMATPAVSGVAALVMSKIPFYARQPSELKSLLLITSNGNVNAGGRSCGNGRPNNVTGWGEVDAYEAVGFGLFAHPLNPKAR